MSNLYGEKLLGTGNHLTDYKVKYVEVKCEDCNGNGFKEITGEDCMPCDGTGSIEVEKWE